MTHMRYQKVGTTGMIGNCRTSALISDQGSIVWLCLPHFDSVSYFGALLDRRRGGYFSICPQIPFTSRQSYIEDTNVLETVFETSAGRIRLVDLFTVTSEEEKHRELWPDNEILRVIEGVDGAVPVEIHFAPKPHFRQRIHDIRPMGKLGFASLDQQHLLLLGTDLDGALKVTEAEFGEEVQGTVMVRGGEKHFLSMIYAEEAPAVVPPRGEHAEERLKRSILYWRQWTERCQYQGPYVSQVRRSALALKLMTYAPSGAIIAAPTTSLPERIGGVRNWDYRFCWLRDASFTMRALMMLGYYDEARAYVNWMLDTGATHRGNFQILYDIHGKPTRSERELPELEGYQGSRPVRLGNAASGQFQLDIYGEVINGIHTYARHHGPFNKDTVNFLLAMGHKVCEVWNQPDDGIWEPRSGRAHHTHSKVMAWVALDRLARMARQFHWKKASTDHYLSVMHQIRNSIEAHGYDPELKTYVQSFGSKAVDASLLVLPLVDYCKAYSPRMLGTLDQIRRQLCQNELVFRYRGTNDGLPGEEGCFGVCSFWLIDALSKSGRPTEARRLFDAFLARGNSVGLWSEEIDPITGEFLGNYPQAFTHIGLINSAITLGQEERSAQAA